MCTYAILIYSLANEYAMLSTILRLCRTPPRSCESPVSTGGFVAILALDSESSKQRFLYLHRAETDT